MAGIVWKGTLPISPFYSGSGTSAVRKYSMANVLLNTIQYNRFFT
jgi:hypothetical protein